MSRQHASPEIDGPRLRDLRKRAGMTVTQAAGKFGISPQYVSAIERGDRPTVAPATYRRICDAMGINWDDLLRRDAA